MTLIIVKFNTKTYETFLGRGSGNEKVDCSICLEGASQVILERLKCTTKIPNGVEAEHSVACVGPSDTSENLKVF
jgi:hypothetical protein